MNIRALAAITILSVYAHGAVTIAAEPVPAGDAGRDRPTGVLRLAIPDFDKIGGGERFEHLRYSLPEMIAVGLVTDERVQYVPDGDFWRLSTSKWPLQQLRRDRGRVFSDENLDALDIDLVLEGQFIEYGGMLHIDATLVDRRKDRSVNISAPTVHASDIYSGLGMMVKELRGGVASLVADGSGNRVAFVCFEDGSTERHAEARNIARDLAVSTLGQIDLRKRVRLLPWSVSKQACETEGSTLSDLAPALEADVVVGGRFVVDARARIEVTPTVYLRQYDTAIELLPLEGTVDALNPLERRLSADVADVLDALHDENGDLARTVALPDVRTYEQFMGQGDSFARESGTLSIAALMYARALSARPDDVAAMQRLGEVRRRQSRLDDARMLLEDAVELAPENPQVRMALARVYEDLGAYDLAVGELERAKEIDGALPGLEFRLGYIRTLLGEYDAARPHLIAAREQDADNPEILNLLGTIDFARGDEASALEQHRRAIALDPDNEEARARIYDIHLRRGRRLLNATADRTELERAVEEFAAAGAIRPGAEIDAWRMFVLNRLERYDEVVAIFEAAKAREEQGKTSDERETIGGDRKAISSAIYNNAGYAYRYLDQVETAIALYAKGLEIDPGNTNLLHNKAVAHKRRGEFAEALALLDAVLERRPKDTAVMSSKADVLLSIPGREAEALELLDRLIGLDPNDAWIRYLKATGLADLGRHEEAVTAYRELLALDEDADRYRVIGYNNLAWNLNQLGRFEEAVAEAERAIALDSGYGNAYNHKGFGLYHLGREEEGIDFIEQAVKLSRPHYGGAHFNLARILAERGDVDAALDNLAEAVRRGRRYAERAAAAPEFEALRADPRFAEIVTG